MIARPERHPGRRCSRDCAIYGCGSWTGIDERVLDERRGVVRLDERIRRATDHLGRGTYEAGKHAAARAEGRPAPDASATAGADRSGGRP